MTYDLTISIVAFITSNNFGLIEQAIESCLASTLNLKLFIIDNSPTDDLKVLCKRDRITYHFNNRNLGFGAAHNIAIRSCLSLSPYHLVLNPDVYFGSGVLEELVAFMQLNPKVGLVMPKVL